MPQLHETDPCETVKFSENALSASDRAWERFCDRVEMLTGRDIPNLDSAYIAHRNGVSASDYALEVVARAGEFL